MSRSEALQSLIQDAYRELLDISTKDALSLSTGIFVGISELVIAEQGEDPNTEIELNSPEQGQRKITIHETESEG